MKIAIITLDMHLARAVAQVKAELAREIPGLSLTLHAAADWEADPAALERCRTDIAPSASRARQRRQRTQRRRT